MIFVLQKCDYRLRDRNHHNFCSIRVVHKIDIRNEVIIWWDINIHACKKTNVHHHQRHSVRLNNLWSEYYNRRNDNDEFEIISISRPFDVT